MEVDRSSEKGVQETKVGFARNVAKNEGQLVDKKFVPSDESKA